ncbi:hypothetical protein [Aliarcobacter butzleri]|uniref:hypothetical protein n=1 Tax=Aliarcobacter butzleri TaxID=28197 RepID=UPI00125FDA1E|nr:hypothetical protein [Aliarcobacter butzleri]MDN5089593.1 hypothetical protein [Aliarcobacter butzleri]
MRNIFKIAILLIFSIYNLYGNNEVLYPVYSIKLDRLNPEIMDILIVREVPLTDKLGKFFGTSYDINLNNLLLFQEKTDKNYLYNILGKIVINENNKLNYEPLQNIDKDENYAIIRQRQEELKINIEYINKNNFTLENVKKILDVDLLNVGLGEKLYSNNEYKLSVKEATTNLINCRFCEQILYIDNKYKIYANSWLFNNNQYYGSHTNKIKLFTKIYNKGNIYKELDSKYIGRKLYEDLNTIQYKIIMNIDKEND